MKFISLRERKPADIFLPFQTSLHKVWGLGPHVSENAGKNGGWFRPIYTFIILLTCEDKMGSYYIMHIYKVFFVDESFTKTRSKLGFWDFRNEKVLSMKFPHGFSVLLSQDNPTQQRVLKDITILPEIIFPPEKFLSLSESWVVVGFSF